MTDTATPKQRGRPRKNLLPASPVAVEDAIVEEIKRGGEVHTTTDAAGTELTQRPVSLADTDLAPKFHPGARVRVYNKYGAAIFTTDAKIEGRSEGSVLESDLDSYNVKTYCVRIA